VRWGGFGDAGFVGRAGLRPWVVAGTGADEELAVMGGVGFHAHGAIAAERGRFRGVVADGVLVADIFRDFGGDAVDVGQGVGEKGEAAGFIGEKLEGAAGAMGFLALVLIAKEQADGVNDGTAEVLHTADGLLEIQCGGVVFAVGDDKQNLLGAASAVRELIGRGDHGVIQGGATTGLDMGKTFAQLIDVGGEILVQEGLVGEVDDEGFVFGIGGADEVEGGGVDGGALVAHGAGVIDQDAEGDGDVGVGERDDVLQGVVFEDVEIALGEVLDEVAVLIDHGAGQDDFVDVAGEGVDALVALDFLVRSVGVRGADGCVVCGVRGDDGVVVDVEGRLGFGLPRRRHIGGGGLGRRGRSRLRSGGSGDSRRRLGGEAQRRGCKQEAEEQSGITAETHRIRHVHEQ